MKKKITELTVKIPLVTEEDLLHNELNMYLLYLEAGIFISNKDKEFSIQNWILSNSMVLLIEFSPALKA